MKLQVGSKYFIHFIYLSPSTESPITYFQNSYEILDYSNNTACIRSAPENNTFYVNHVEFDPKFYKDIPEYLFGKAITVAPEFLEEFKQLLHKKEIQLQMARIRDLTQQLNSAKTYYRKLVNKNEKTD